MSPGYYLLVLFLFGLGLALGCDYPTAHLIISESIPSRARGQLVLAAFGFQAVGALVGTIVGFVVLKNIPEIGAWRWMYATAIIPALLVTFGRLTITESAHWLLVSGRSKDAHEEVVRLLTRDPAYPKRVNLLAATVAPASKSVVALFAPGNIRATILASVPWFLQDLGTYGIGIFTPTILAATLGHKTAHVRSLADLVGNDELAARGAALIDVLLIVGILAAIFLVNRIGSIRLQIWGFIGCAAGLAIAAASTFVTGTTATLLIFAGFMLFNFMTNLGPNAQTYLLAGEVFPTSVRGTGAGFAAAFAKIGAVTTAFLFPVLMADIGTQNPAVHPDRHLARRRARHLRVPHRHHRRQSRAHRRRSETGSTRQGDFVMSDLVFIAFPSEQKAEEVREKVLELQKEYLIELGDAVVAVKDDKGRIKLNQLMNTTAAGAVSGALWGTLIGLIFLNPLLGTAIGAASGALGGTLTDVGINDQFMKDAASALQPGSAGLFLLVRKMTTDKVLADLEGVGGTVMRTSFDETKEAALREALAGHAKAAEAKPAAT